MKRFVLALAVLVLGASAVQAHFIWIVPDKEGVARVIFSDSLQPDDPKLLAKIARTEVFIRPAEGKEISLKWTEGKDAYVLTAPGRGAQLLGAVCTYGVIQRGNTEPFLLNYSAAALVGCSTKTIPVGLKEPSPRLPLQIVPIKGSGLTFQVYWQGKPLSQAEVVVLPPGQGESVQAKLDSNGCFELPAKDDGLYGIRARHVEKKKGQHDGKDYQEVRHYATLVVGFERGGAVDPKPGAPGGGPKEDPAASKLLKDARAARAQWVGFPGFTADVAVNFDGKVSRGKVTVDPAGRLTFEQLDKAVEAWARRTLGSVVNHRLDDSASRDTPCAFPDDNANHPLGRAIRVLNDELHSSYRIKDNQLMEVNRQMRDGRFTISVLENRPNAEGKFLSVSFVVSFWSVETGELQRSEAHHQTWTRQGKFDLPVTTTVVTGGKDQAKRAQSLALSNHKLLSAAGK